MKLRNAAASAVGSVGALVLANRYLRSRAGEFEPFLDGEQGSYRWRGFDIAYTELGDPEDDDVLLLHGVSAASSSHEFHQIATALSDDYHVIAPDLPGFGHSDRPPLLYSASLYTTFVADAIADLSDDPPVVVASSLTGAYTALAAREVETERLVLTCPTDTTTESRRVWLRALIRSPGIGEGLFNLVTSKVGLRRFSADHGYYDATNQSEELVDYQWQIAHQPGARFAPASFVAGFLDPDADIGEALAEADVPVTLVWGRNTEMTPLSEGRELAERGDAGLVVFDRAKLLPHVEHPDQFVDVVRDEAATTQ
jgi:pimeloyl-ACP methyl ester carboxylesterase